MLFSVLCEWLIKLNIFLYVLEADNGQLYTFVCSFFCTELLDCVILVILWLLSSKVLHLRKCAQLCIIQKQYGVEIDTSLSPEHGLPVHIWHLAGWKLWRASDKEEVRYCVCICVCVCPSVFVFFFFQTCEGKWLKEFWLFRH